jgi:hypothetical protein
MSTVDGQYEDCVVAFLDILGFSTFVDESVSNSETLENLIQAMQAVHAIPAGEKKVSTVGGTQRTIDIRRRFFSDSLVFFHRTKPDDIPQLLFLIRYIQDQLWENGYCLRGSIVLGKMYWMQRDDNVTVGPGLIEAYKAESETALYPRITVSPGLSEYIAHENIQANPFGADRQPLDYYIRHDADGICFLDLLNPGITRHAGESLVQWDGGGYSVQYDTSKPSTHADVLRAVHRIIEDNNNAKSPKVRQKYAWLKTYCNLHASNDTEE